jgi:hopanoid biosynthesis associated protein HpnK
LKGLIITGDDFGLSLQVNEAIEEAPLRGVLTYASLMMGAKAASDAVNRAGRLPSLRVGLHVVLVDGRPALPPEAIPDLVDRRGEFSSNLLKASLDFFLRHQTRQQMEAEIRAQFREFGNTGLRLDHVNAHHHMHLHPTVGRLILKVGLEHGVGRYEIALRASLTVVACLTKGPSPEDGRVAPSLSVDKNLKEGTLSEGRCLK